MESCQYEVWQFEASSLPACFIQKLIPLNFLFLLLVQSNLFNKDTKGTEPSVRFTGVLVL